MDWMLLQTAVAASLMLPLIVFTWQRPDRTGLSRTLTGLLVLILLWTIGMAIDGRPGVPKALILALTVPPACFMSPLFLILMLRYGRMGPFLEKPKTEWALIAPFVVYMLIFMTNDLHGWMRDPYADLTGRGTVNAGTPIFWAFQVASVATAGAGLAVCARLAWTTTSPATRRSTTLMGIATSLPLVAHLSWIFDLTPLEVPLTPATLAVTSCLIVMAIMRYEFLEVQPIARRDVIEASNIAVLIADIDRVVVDVNPAAARMLGIARNAIVGRVLDDVAMSLGITHPEDALARLLEDPGTAYDAQPVEFETTDGRTLEANVGRPTDRDGAPAGYFLVLNDRSSERQAQQRLYQSQKLESIGILAAGVAHEVNNPLSFVRANFEHLGQLSMSVEGALERLPKDLAEQLQEVPTIVDESLAGLGRIQDVVQGLLGFSRMPTEQASDVTCNEIVEDAIRFASLGPDARLEIEGRLADDLPTISGVRAQLVQVLLNLLLNAKKSLADWDDPQIVVSTRLEQGGVEICVEDNGPGVPEEFRSRIFDAFFTTREPNQGTGLGLAIAFDIVRDHKGELVYETPTDGGARFVVRLPVSTPRD